MSEPVVLSGAELDVVWETERLGSRHIALDVPSPGATQLERAELIEKAWHSLESRGLARGRRASGNLLDMLGILATPAACVDVWAWADRQVSGLAATTGSHAMLGVVDGDEFWLIPARTSSLAESAVSVVGELHAGVGQSVTLPHAVLVDAAAQADGDAHVLVTALQDRGFGLFQAQELAGMLFRSVARGQFGAERRRRDGARERAQRVVAFHDADAGRYLMQLGRNSEDVDWCTVTPADNALLAQRVWELLEEV